MKKPESEQHQTYHQQHWMLKSYPPRVLSVKLSIEHDSRIETFLDLQGLQVFLAHSIFKRLLKDGLQQNAGEKQERGRQRILETALLSWKEVP